MKRGIPYGIGDFGTIRRENYTYVDKTRVIPALEEYRYPFFIRPRRFGKSLLVSTLAHYYDISKADQFEELFGELWIGQNPTREKNAYLVLSLDFSGIETGNGVEGLFRSFSEKLKVDITLFLGKYSTLFQDRHRAEIEGESDPALLFKKCVSHVTSIQKKMYLLIDEYDNFANDLIGANEDETYYQVLSRTGFVRTFYEAVKEGAQSGVVSRIFLTGVSPIMLDDLTSGFNISRNITTQKRFQTALGFTQGEVDHLVDCYNVLPEPRKQQALQDMKTYYNGYRFSREGDEKVYNPDMVWHFLDAFSRGAYPESMIDMNVRTDYGKLERLLREDRSSTGESSIETVLQQREILTQLVEMFPLESLREKESLVSLLFYMGLLTIKEAPFSSVVLQVPNLAIHGVFWESAFRRLRDSLEKGVDISTLSRVSQEMARTGDPTEFIRFCYESVMGYASNRDWRQMQEKHVKMILLSFLSITGLYIPYSELEMNGGYSDIVLVPDTRYPIHNSQIWELKVVKQGEDAGAKVAEARKQVARYLQDSAFLRSSQGTQVKSFVLLARREGVEILPAEA